MDLLNALLKECDIEDFDQQAIPLTFKLNAIENLCLPIQQTTLSLSIFGPIKSIISSILSWVTGIVSHILSALGSLLTPKGWTPNGELSHGIPAIFAGKVGLEIEFGK